jgi:hypothetical protein
VPPAAGTAIADSRTTRLWKPRRIVSRSSGVGGSLASRPPRANERSRVRRYNSAPP